MIESMDTNSDSVTVKAKMVCSSLTRGTIFSSIFNLLTTIIGAGTLALPYAFRQGGLVYASFLFFVVLVIAIIVGLFLYDCQEICRRLFPSVDIGGYADLAELTLGRIGRIAVMVVLIILLYLTLVAYMIYTRDQLQLIIDFALHKSGHIPQCWILHNCAVVTSMAFLPLFPITLLKNLSPLQFTSTISILCIVFVAIFMGIKLGDHLNVESADNATKALLSTISSSNSNSSGGGRWDSFTLEGITISLFPSTVQGAITCISYSGLCFLCHFQLFSLEKELHKPKRWKLNFIVVASMLIAYTIYNVVAFSGYLQFGADTKEDIMVNYPSDSVLVTIARIALFITLLFSYPVLFHPTRAVINEIIHYVYELSRQKEDSFCIQSTDSEDESLLSTSNNMFKAIERKMLYRREVKLSNVIWVCESLIIFCLTFLPASFIPSVGYVWNFVGAIGGTLVLYIFPPLFLLRLRYFCAIRMASRSQQSPSRSIWTYYSNITVWKDIVAIAIIMLGVFVLVAGNYVAVETIIKQGGESFSTCLQFNCIHYKQNTSSNEL